jgi:AmiR/NasT family two-component response regulator
MDAQHERDGDGVVRRLQEELAGRTVIDVATGIVVSQRGCSAEDAAQSLLARSRLDQVPSREVAATVVAQVRAEFPPPWPPFDDI